MKKILLLFIITLSQFFYSQSDCISAIPVCGNSNINYNPGSNGNVVEQTSGSCLGLEHYSVWYVFTAATSGTIEFTIDPNTVPGVTHYDYDFAVYGPNINCATWDFGNAIRCNFSGTTGATGLSSTITGDKWEDALPVLAGETYYLLIDNYIPSNPYGFSLTWGGTATLTSPFTDPTLTPNPFLPPGPANNGIVYICSNPSTFNFSTLSTGIVNGNPNFSVSYHTSSNDALTNSNPITAPISVNTTNTYYYAIHYLDPTNPSNPLNDCTQTGTIKFEVGPIITNNVTVKGCNNNGAGSAIFNLTTGNVYSDPTAVKKYFPTLADLNAGTNEIISPSYYSSSAPKKIYVKITTTDGCSANAEITLEYYPPIPLTPATLESCFIENAFNTAQYDLTQAVVTTATGTNKKFYKTKADALAGTNEITNPTNYISAAGEVYVRVINENECYYITTITLKVIPPVKSTVLKDKTICMEDRTTLDAGPGFAAYEWSTGATTQSIQGVAVGSYWVKLKTGNCFTLQQVNVYPTPQPVIASVDIKNNTITVNASGGTAPYEYSLDGINWQSSNVFTDLPRGENKIFLRDSYDCTPIQVQLTVPNLVNAITPNGDNVNDAVDYSALAYKKNLVFTVYNRYGNKIYQADKVRNYKWDGTSGGKKLNTGTYWYTITWNENDPNSTPTKYDGWVLIKNRE
ncbi:T9SS type B sorting domain-containing protein [Chryseobacterium echinoideorum]|uniref:T9SS type B sorting domain-containing protein n=1 Tax=Chryseobacterium echinoideorum TaxID=1549648 RepID=UPI001184B295|nr:gliding motility-associated C-terminal domain-containing protein [Chryseobacterium echinoideorum]